MDFKRLITLFFVLFFAMNAYAVCTAWNPLTWGECLAPISQAFALPFQAFDSEALITSISNVNIKTNDPDNQISGNVIQATMSIGSGNDIAVGAFDQDTTQASGVSSDFSNPQFFIGVRKNKLNTLLQITGNERALQDVVENRENILSTISIFEGGIWTPSRDDVVTHSGIRKSQVYLSLLQPEISECESRPDFISHGWQPLTDQCLARQFFTGICTDNRAVVNFICYTRGQNFFFKVFGPSSFDVDLGITVRNAAREVTNEKSITESQQRVDLFDGGSLVGHVKYFGSLSTFYSAPIAQTTGAFYPAKFGGQWFVVNQGQADSAEEGINDLRNARSGFFVPGGTA